MSKRTNKTTDPDADNNNFKGTVLKSEEEEAEQAVEVAKTAADDTEYRDGKWDEPLDKPLADTERPADPMWNAAAPAEPAEPVEDEPKEDEPEVPETEETEPAEVPEGSKGVLDKHPTTR